MTELKQFQNGAAAASAQEETKDSETILIGLGANLPSRFGPPVQTLQIALERLNASRVHVVRCSRFWRTQPVPLSDQPWFINAVALVETALSPEALLAVLHHIEADFGRERSVRNAPRLIDLDLLAYRRLVRSAAPPLLPHPRLAERAFVLQPLADLLPAWRHPSSGRTLADMIAALPSDQLAEPL